MGQGGTGLLNVMASAIGAPDPQHDDLARSGTPIEAASSVVNENFVTVVGAQPDAAALLTPVVEQALRALAESDVPKDQKNSLSVDVGQSILRVYCRSFVEPAHVEAFVAIGVSVAAAVRGTRSLR